ncbi:DNA photolyase family protein [Aestuariibacter halophilus]|uniref:DNA photolyase family protein n=2 Tax=Fluctibacter halophilus TaxID=226011 RepID=A0ABS8G9U2_9ALTE|nr:deoxyribodipyrimidine photo-lyase [Aestuariibacter halophilus]MCC2616575.1 DNA photolyase family protein [Aestuariibacter halophilus]
MWFRQDLRLRDNPALHYAAQLGPVMALFIQDTAAPDGFHPGAASRWWLHQSLHALNQSLNDKLHVKQGNATDIIVQLVKQQGIRQVVWNRQYEPWQIDRDTALKAALKALGVEVKSFNSLLLWEPWNVLNKSGEPYKVFTPYYRKGCLQQPAPRPPLGAPDELHLEHEPSLDDGIDALQLMPQIDWYEGMADAWTPGEAGASERLSAFLPQRVADYRNHRDQPSLPGTSRLSPHLHFGEISPHQIWYASLGALHGDWEQPGLDTFLSELGWREFSYYLLYHFNNLPQTNFNRRFDAFQWRNDPTGLRAWQRGMTGIPIVDAGMRELWHTGYMHNRVRMVVGSFLVKNLLVDWRQGERWFWDCLVDGDLAANSASWQWVAGCGADAAPYFRVFNPVLQGEKFDAKGDYVRRWCPELSKLPNKYLHQPWQASDQVLRDANLTLGQDYPHPIVDLKASRQRALDAFAALKETA